MKKKAQQYYSEQVKRIIQWWVDSGELQLPKEPDRVEDFMNELFSTPGYAGLTLVKRATLKKKETA